MTEFEKKIIECMTDNRKFEQDVIQRLARIEEQNNTQFRRIGELEKAINGNGKKGLLDRVGDIEQEIEKLKGLHQNSDKTKSTVIMWITVALNAIGTLYAIWKHH